MGRVESVAWLKSEERNAKFLCLGNPRAPRASGQHPWLCSPVNLVSSLAQGEATNEEKSQFENQFSK